MKNELIKKILIIFIMFLTTLFVMMKITKYLIIDFKSSFYRTFKNNLERENNGIYNVNTNIKLIDNFLNNKITIINIYNYNNIDFLKSLKLSKYINNNYNDINIFDIVVKDDENLNINNLNNDSKVEFLLKNYGIKNPVLYTNKSLLKKKFGINFKNNKFLILDEMGNIRYAFNNDIDLGKLKSKINQILMQKKFFSVRNTVNNIYDENSKFIDMFSKIIFIKNERYNYPLMAILDSGTKRILVTSLHGDIIYDIMSKNFCLPSGLKYTNGKLYVTDMCDSSIKIINFEDQSIDTFIDDQELFGITDFEFLDEDNILVSFDINGGMKIYNIKTKEIQSLNAKLNLDYEIGKVNKIIKHKNKFYYLDLDYNILYSYDGKENKIEVNFSNYENIAFYDKIKSFYINSDRNIYFIDTENNRIIHKIKDNLIEEELLNSFDFPKDMFIFKNIIYVLENKMVKKINLYKNEKENLKLSFSDNRKLFFNINDNIDIKDTENNKIYNIIVNNNQFFADNLLNNINIVPHSPSFLAIFEKSGKNEIILHKLMFYNNLINNSKIDIEDGKEYFLYGKIYYFDDKEIKIRTINNIILINKKNKSSKNS